MIRVTLLLVLSMNLFSCNISKINKVNKLEQIVNHFLKYNKQLLTNADNKVILVRKIDDRITISLLLRQIDNLDVYNYLLINYDCYSFNQNIMLLDKKIKKDNFIGLVTRDMKNELSIKEDLFLIINQENPFWEFYLFTNKEYKINRQYLQHYPNNKIFKKYHRVRRLKFILIE